MASLPLNKLSWTVVYDGMWKNGDGKTQGGEKHADSMRKRKHC